MRPSAARVFYNVVDAWIPEAADRDLVPALEARLSPRELAALERELLWLEWEPRLRGWSWRGFAWMPRARRRALLERSLLRRRVRRLLARVEEAWGYSREGA